MDFYLGFFAGVFSSLAFVLAGFGYVFLTRDKAPEYVDKVLHPGQSVPFMRRKPEVRKPRVNDDSRMAEKEREERNERS